jgi:hypothetical protein
MMYTIHVPCPNTVTSPTAMSPVMQLLSPLVSSLSLTRHFHAAMVISSHFLKVLQSAMPSYSPGGEKIKEAEKNKKKRQRYKR